jgi:hypothetical protein
MKPSSQCRHQHNGGIPGMTMPISLFVVIIIIAVALLLLFLLPSLLSLSPYDVIISTIVAAVTIVAIIAVALVAPVTVTLATIAIALTAVAINVLTLAINLVVDCCVPSPPIKDHCLPPPLGAFVSLLLLPLLSLQ